MPAGEIVEFVRTWEEDGGPCIVHQIHVISVREGQIAVDRAWCGGRWSAALLAEMAAATSEAGAV